MNVCVGERDGLLLPAHLEPLVIFVRPLVAYAVLSCLYVSKQGTRVRRRMDRRRRPPVTFASLGLSVMRMLKMSGKHKNSL